MLRLRALGGLTLALDDGVVTGAYTQRRRLALLALLAVARGQGLSRDKVLAYLWPERQAERARHALNQMLHAQRKQFAPEQVFLGGKTLRLNPAVIRTDVGEFETALDQGAQESAVALWSGPFLDGFFLTEAPEFERWAEAQRERLSQRVCTACRDLAKAATARGDWDRSASWWQRAAELDPLDSQVACSLVEALASAGNRAAAIRHARRHTERLRDELGLAPDTRLEALVAQLRVVDSAGVDIG